MMFAISQVNAQQQQVDTYLYVYASPNPVGVGQTEYLSLFFTKPLPPAFGQMFGGGVYHGLTVKVTKPDGTTQNFGPYTTDTTGGVGGIQFVPNVVGNYTAQAFYPGENMTGTDTIFLKAAESPIVTFTAQEEQIPTFSSPPLPTEYWSRPIYATNYAWAEIGGNWWGNGKPAFMNTGGYDASGNNLNPYSQAPNSAHIMWVKPNSPGGQPGLPIEPNQESHYTSTSILYKQFEPVILNGVIFYDLYTNTPTVRPGRTAVDIRTGETLWTTLYDGDTLAFGSVLKFHTIQEYGSISWLWAMTDSSPRMFKLYDPMTGTFVANVTDLPASLVGMFGSSPAALVDTSDFLTQGSVLMHWTEAGQIVMWNSSLCLFGTPSAVVLRPSGNINFTRGIQWRVDIPANLSGAAISPPMGIAAKTDEALLVSSYGAIIPTFATEFGNDYAVDAAVDTKTGALLWGPIRRQLVLYHEIPVVAAGEGYYVRHDKDTNQAYGYSLTTGQQLWGPVQLEGLSLSTLARGAAIAYDKVYIWDFGGFVNGIDLATGNIAWTYSRGSAGYENPYGVYPIWHFGSHSIADGKLFLSESRMYDPPLFPNARKLAINCTDGTLVWSVLGFYGRNTGAIADGFLLGYNSYDAQIYSFGKGLSATTATVQDTILPLGNSVLITGTVIDKSPGTQDADRLARFPHGVPAVSDDSMAGWMEYVYMQQTCPGDVTGVPVTIDVIDNNGNYRNIAVVTTDGYGAYSLMWEPDIPGKYTVIATFAGSESYWSSYAETAFGVMEAPEPTLAPTAPPESIADQYFIPGIGIIVAAIAVVGIVLAILLRKR
jgi:hypothetical protein